MTEKCIGDLQDGYEEVSLVWYGKLKPKQRITLTPIIKSASLCDRSLIQQERMLNPLTEDIEHLLDFLLLGKAFKKGLLARHRAVLLQGPSPEITKAFRLGLNRRLTWLWEEMQAYQSQSITPTPDQNLWWQLQLNNILNYLAYAAWQAGEVVVAPHYVEKLKSWQCISYQVSPLQLTPTWLGSPYYAYGLTSDNSDAKSLLLFMGTTYPGSDGFLWTLIADTTPFMSIGSLLLRFGRKTLANWINTQSAQGKQVECHGQSLGGALSLLMAVHFKQAISKSYAMAPAGTYGHLSNINNATVIFGGSDHVCQVGHMPQGPEFIYILPPRQQVDKTSPNLARLPGLRGTVYSHIAALSWQPGARAYKVNREMIDEKPGRKKWNYLWYVSWLMGPFLWAIKLVLAAGQSIARGLAHLLRSSESLPSQIIKNHPDAITHRGLCHEF